MDIVYTLGGNSRHDNIELRWSLRSMVKNCRNIGNVIVVGVIPDWLSDDVIKIPVEQRSRIVQKNMIRNIKAVVDAGVVDEDFLVSADDHFYVKPVDFDLWPIYKVDNLPHLVKFEEGHYEYKLGLVGSRWLLSRYGLPVYNTSCHYNVRASARSLKYDYELMRAATSDEYRMNAWSLIGNMALAEHPEIPVVQHDDIKITEPIRDIEQLNRIIGESEFFSIDDDAFDGGALEMFMNSAFGEMCRYEKEV